MSEPTINMKVVEYLRNNSFKPQVETEMDLHEIILNNLASLLVVGIDDNLDQTYG